MRGSREISLVPSLHRASTDALMIIVCTISIGLRAFAATNQSLFALSTSRQKDSCILQLKVDCYYNNH